MTKLLFALIVINGGLALGFALKNDVPRATLHTVVAIFCEIALLGMLR